MEQVMVQHDMKASEKTFKEGLAALESLLDDEFSKIFNETNQEVREAVEAAPITEKHRVLQEHVENWADRLAALIKRAFERYTALALAISRFVEGEPIEWVEGQVRQFLEPRLGQPMIPNPEPGTPGTYPSFAVRVIGGQKAHKGIILWIAEACGELREIFSNWLIKGTLELDDEAVDSWEAPAWLALDQDDQLLEGRLDAKTTAFEVGLIHFELWTKLKDPIKRARLRATLATLGVAVSIDPAVEGEPLTEQTIKAEATKKDFDPRKYGGKELCIAVSYHKDGFRNLRRVALGMRNKANIRYSGHGYPDPLSWYQNNPIGFTQHLWKLRQKAKDNNWYDSIPSNYYRIYVG